VGAVAEGQEAFGEVVRRRRAEAGLTQEQLAEQAGLSVRAISDIERGLVSRPRRSSVAMLAGVLGPGGLGGGLPVPAAGGRAARAARAARAELATPRVPRQLPTAARHFVGRGAELAALDALVPDPGATGGAVALCVIGGTAGVGKTALAVHWAHRAADRFPDGQLYVNLRGFGPSARPLGATEAVRQLLDGLGVAPERVPAGPDAQAGLYRSLLSGARMLIVADNAGDAAQVRPLLPGTPGCLVLVTSRNRLTGLAAHEDARLLTLEVLSEAEAREFLARRLAPGRAAREPAAVTELARMCAALPLALSVAAARAAASPRLPLTALAAELRGSSSRLELLDTQDPATDPRTVFSWSCLRLTRPAARMFRLLGVHPGPDISLPAAASLAGRPPGAARATLEELARAHLVTEHLAGRFACHDLLRAYAAEQARGTDGDGAIRAALHRVLDHYLHSAAAATVLIHPFLDRVTLDPPLPQVCLAEVSTAPQAVAWFRAERQILVAACGLAAAEGFDRHAWQLPWAIGTFLNWHGYWDDLLTIQAAALTAARGLGDLAGQAEAHRYLGQAQVQLGTRADGVTHLEQALEAARESGNSALYARAHCDLSWAFESQGRYHDALGHARQSLQICRDTGHQIGEAINLNSIGWFLAHLGHYREALSHCEQALALNQKLDNRRGLASTLDSLCYIHSRLGNHAYALAYQQQAVLIPGGVHAGMLGRHEQALHLERLGEAYQTAGDHTAARGAWRDALTILTDLNHPDTERLRSRLGRPGA
jgi:tetratricopeptide (TPR) repeat protein/transcriptional regulator with XRE-family HTH domain